MEERGKPDNPAEDSSVSSSLEHLIAGSQGVITKRLDLALLEAQEMLSRLVERAAVAGVAILLAAGTWFAFAAAIVLLVAPNSDPVFQLAVFGLINAAGTLGLLRFIQRHGLPIAIENRNPGDRTSTQSPTDARI